MNVLNAAQTEEVTEYPEIISVAFYHVDVENKTLEPIGLDNSAYDFDVYLKDLLEEVEKKKQKRAYRSERETTEFWNGLKSFYDAGELPENSYAEALAKRLLQKEINADVRYGHLGKPGEGHIKKGSFLQFLFKRDENDISYLGVKLEHESFLDESDFIKKVGLAVANKVYKACKVSFDESGNPFGFFIYDTNSKPSVYWWKDFLELKELKNDSYNTRTASEEVVRVLSRYKKKHPADYTILRNSTIAAFRQQGEMDYIDFVDKVFKNYEPQDPELQNKLPEIISKLEALPNEKDFDTQFGLIPSEVPFKQTKVALSKEISLSIKDGIESLEDKVWSERSDSGRKFVVIESPEGFAKFKEKRRV